MCQIVLHILAYVSKLNTLMCGIFGFCLLSFPQNERKIFKLRQLSFFCKSKHRWLCAQKTYKLRQIKLSQFVYFSLVLREQEETKTKYLGKCRCSSYWLVQKYTKYFFIIESI